MSLVSNCYKLLNTRINNICKFGGYLSRNIATVEDYKIKWNRPEKIKEIDTRLSGDLGLNVSVKPTDTMRFYEKSKELEDADDIVKKMFTAEFQGRKQFRILKREEITGYVRRHICDRGSVEVKIAAMTSKIHDLQKYTKERPLDKQTHVFLKELIDKRKKFLRLLRLWDYKRFEWILEQLNLVYKPQPPLLGWVSRKDSIRKLTQTHCDNIVQQKLDAYKAELKENQKTFYAEKAEKLAQILKDEEEYGLPPTVTQEEVEIARKKAEELAKDNTA